MKIISFSILDENYTRLEKYCSERSINRSLFIVQSILKNLEDNNETKTKNQNRSSGQTGKRIGNTNRKGSGKKRSGSVSSIKKRTFERGSGPGKNKSNSGKSVTNNKAKASPRAAEEIEIIDF